MPTRLSDNSSLLDNVFTTNLSNALSAYIVNVHISDHQPVIQGGVLSSTLFNIHTADIPTPTAPVQVMLYADDITITSTHTSMSAARKYKQPYIHKVYDWAQHNNLIINPDKTTCTLFTPDPAEYNSNLGLNINNKALLMALHPKVLGLTLDPKLTYNAHIQNIATHAQKPLQVIKTLTGTTEGDACGHL